MKKKILLFFLLAFTLTFAACKDEPQEEKSLPDTLSDTKLIGFSLGGAGYGTEIECMSSEVVIYKDKKVECIFNNETIYEGTISDENFDRLNEELDFAKLYYLKVRDNDEVLDGSSSHIYFYDKEGNYGKSVGGYMIENKYYNDARQLLCDVVPLSDISACVQHEKRKLEAAEVVHYLALEYSSNPNVYLVDTFESVEYNPERPAIVAMVDLDGDGIDEMLFSPWGRDYWNVHTTNVWDWEESYVGIIDFFDPETGLMFGGRVGVMGGETAEYKMENGKLAIINKYFLECSPEEENWYISIKRIDADGNETELSIDEYSAVLAKYETHTIEGGKPFDMADY